MNKKLHKTGIVIISTLAPACALGITAGIIVANLPKQDQSISKEEWLKQYHQRQIRLASNYNTFEIGDFKVDYNGQSVNLGLIESYAYMQEEANNSEKVKRIVWYDSNYGIGEYNSRVITYSYINIVELVNDANNAIFSKDESDDSLKVVITYTDEYEQTLVFNKDGYVTEDTTLYVDGSQESYKYEYLKAAHTVKNIKMGFDEHGFYSTISQMSSKEGVYSYTFDVVDENPFNQFKVSDIDDNLIELDSPKIYIGTQKQDNWEYKDKIFHCDTPIESGSITIKFGIKSDQDYCYVLADNHSEI